MTSDDQEDVSTNAEAQREMQEDVTGGAQNIPPQPPAAGEPSESHDEPAALDTVESAAEGVKQNVESAAAGAQQSAQDAVSGAEQAVSDAASAVKQTIEDRVTALERQVSAQAAQISTLLGKLRHSL